MAAVADIGVIGGSGFYEFLTDAEEVRVDTPFGEPSETVLVGEVGGKRVAFLPRHGRDHRFPPHKIPYRANLWALRALGVRRILAPSAVGSLTTSYGPGTLIIPDQLVDRTTRPGADLLRRVRGARAVRRPVLPVGPGARDRAARQAGWVPAGSGTLVVIDGPRFSTRAESQWYAAQGWTLIGMTGHPEAVLARELALCYTHARPGHRHRRRRRGGRRGHPGRGVRGLRQEHQPGSASWWRRSSRPSRAEREDDLCAHALDGIRLPIDLP